MLGSVGGKEQGLGFLLESFARVRGARRLSLWKRANSLFRRRADGGDRPPDRGCGTRCAATFESTLDALRKDRRAEARAERLGRRPNMPNSAISSNSACRCSRAGERPPVVVRTGNFQADQSVFRVAARSGLRLSSNIAVPICRPLGDGFVSSAASIGSAEFWSPGVLLQLLDRRSHSASRPLYYRVFSCRDHICFTPGACTSALARTHPSRTPRSISKGRISAIQLAANRANQGRLRAVFPST